MTKDYTDEQAREAIAIVAELAANPEPDWSFLGNLRRGGNRAMAERILAFGKSPEPKRWPIIVRGPNDTEVEVNVDENSYVDIRYRTSNVLLREDGMDRLFVAWAEEQGIDLELAYHRTKIWEESALAFKRTPSADAIRAVLDNARSKA